jgi:hypothetical protein
MPQHHRIEFGLIGRLILVVRRAASGFVIDQSQMDGMMVFAERST